MKKRLLSILLMCCMVLTLPLGIAAAEETTGTVAEVETSDDLITALAGTAETVRLGANIDISASLAVSRTVTLDLNDHVLKMTENGSVIKVNGGGDLTLTDSAETKTVKYFSKGENDLWTLLTDGTSENTVTGGVITGGKGTNGYGGGVYVAGGGKFTMRGGSITGCTAQATTTGRAYGGGVFVAEEDGEFTMNGGSITGCTAVGGSFSFGGGIHNEGKTTLSGTAEIRDCHAKAGTDNYAYGGGVSDTNGVLLDISGGVKITGCTIDGKKEVRSDAMNIGYHGTIRGGTFDGSVDNGGTISGGTFNGSVVNGKGGSISEGTFNGSVVNKGAISGGTFNGGVTNEDEGTISGATVVAEASDEDTFLEALKNKNVTTIKLMKDITVEAAEGGEGLTIDRAITLVNDSTNNGCTLQLHRPLTIAEDGALTLEDSVYLYPCDSMEVNGGVTVGAGCGVSFEIEGSSLTIHEGGTVTTQPAGETTTSGLLSLWKNVKLTVEGTLVNNGRFYVSDMENLKKVAGIGGELILDSMTITENYALDLKGNPLTIEGSLDFKNGANLTVVNASKVEATDVTLSGGSYYCLVTAGGQPHGSDYAITGGSFYGPVTVRDQGGGQSAPISGGTFYGGIAGTYTISGGTFYNGSFQEGFSLPEEGRINGRKVTYMDGKAVYAIQVVSGKASAPDAPSKDGYTFAGWYSGDAKWNFADDTVTENLTLTAKWERIHTSAPRYNVAVADSTHGSVTVSPKSASAGSTVTVTVTPDKGYALETLTVADKNGNALDLTDKGGGKYTFTMSSGPVTVAATFMDDNTMLNFFVDVPAGAYYYDAVLWAVENGITQGTDDTHFSPNGICTRAQAVTFLWRTAGSPEPETRTMPFTDVPADSYYYDAVLWAVENGITKGTSDTTFSPNMTCSRAQIVTFLWRSEKSPAAGTANPFADVKSTAYYADAVLWAVKEDITKGTTNTTFSPDADCARAQIVTFLWRCKK